MPKMPRATILSTISMAKKTKMKSSKTCRDGRKARSKGQYEALEQNHRVGATVWGEDKGMDMKEMSFMEKTWRHPLLGRKRTSEILVQWSHFTNEETGEGTGLRSCSPFFCSRKSGLLTRAPNRGRAKGSP